MNKKAITTLEVITKSELLAMLKLVQMVCHANEFEKVTKEDWINYCMTAFSWDQLTAELVTNRLRRAATRELKNELVV